MTKPAAESRKPAAVIVAAGNSTRMGSAKALLEWDGAPLLAHAARALEKIAAPLVVVVPPGKNPVRALAESLGAAVADGVPAGEMFDSLRAGLAAVPGGVPVMVATCDQPLAGAPWLSTLAGLALAHGDGPWLPLCNGRRGHPVVLDAATAGRVRRADLAPDGLRGFLRGAEKLYELETGDPACLIDLDTPEEWKKFLAGARG